MNTSAEAQVLTKYYDKLQKLIQSNLLVISSQAYAKHLLSSDEHSYCTHMMYLDGQKANHFMQAVRKKVEVDSSFFDTFIAVLRLESSYVPMVEKLEAEVQQLKNQQPDLAQGASSAGPVGNPSNDDGIDINLIDGTTVLNYNAMMDVLRTVHNVAVNFVPLGEALRITQLDLAIAEKKHKDDPKNGLREIIKLWLTQTYPVEIYGDPTWRMLAEAVAHPFGGDNRVVAREIAKKHPVPIGQANQSQ